LVQTNAISKELEVQSEYQVEVQENTNQSKKPYDLSSNNCKLEIDSNDMKQSDNDQEVVQEVVIPKNHR
jgi:hypothetical protein